MDESFLIKDMAVLGSVRKVLKRKGFISGEDELLLCRKSPWSVKGFKLDAQTGKEVKNRGFTVIEEGGEEEKTELVLIYAWGYNEVPKEELERNPKTRKRLTSWVSVRVWNDADF